jgi:hypothetical protein
MKPYYEQDGITIYRRIQLDELRRSSNQVGILLSVFTLQVRRHRQWPSLAPRVAEVLSSCVPQFVRFLIAVFSAGGVAMSTAPQLAHGGGISC